MYYFSSHTAILYTISIPTVLKISFGATDIPLNQFLNYQTRRINNCELVARKTKSIPITMNVTCEQANSDQRRGKKPPIRVLFRRIQRNRSMIKKTGAAGKSFIRRREEYQDISIPTGHVSRLRRSSASGVRAFGKCRWPGPSVARRKFYLI